MKYCRLFDEIWWQCRYKAGYERLSKIHLVEKREKKTSRDTKRHSGKQEKAIVEAEVFLNSNADKEADYKCHNGKDKQCQT